MRDFTSLEVKDAMDSSVPSSLRPTFMAGSLCSLARRSDSIFSRRGNDSLSEAPLRISSVFSKPSTRLPHCRSSRSRHIASTRGTVLHAVPQGEPPPFSTSADDAEVPSPNTEILTAISEKRPELVASTGATTLQISPWTHAYQTPRTPTAIHSRPSRERLSRVGVWRDGITHWDDTQATTHGSSASNRPLTDLQNVPSYSDRTLRPSLSVVIPEGGRRSLAQALPTSRKVVPAAASVVHKYTMPNQAIATAISQGLHDERSPASVSPLECSQAPLIRHSLSASSHLCRRSLSLPPGRSRKSSESSHGSSTTPDEDTSCYSRSSSHTSLDTLEIYGRNGKGMDWSFLQLPKQTTSVAFSSVNPLAAGVFDEPAANLNKPLPPSPTPEEALFDRSRKRTSKSQSIGPTTGTSRTPGSTVTAIMVIPVTRSCRSLHRFDEFDQQFRRTNPHTASVSCPPSPTLTEAVFDLQTKLGFIPPLQISQSSGRSISLPVVESIEARLQQATTTQEASPHPVSTQLKTVFTAPSRAPTIPTKSRKRRLQRLSEQAPIKQSPPPRSPRRKSNPCGVGDCLDQSTNQVPRQSFTFKHECVANITAVPMPSPTLIPSAQRPTTAGETAETAGCLPRPRMTTTEPRVQSARLSVLVPEFEVDDGLILADELVDPMLPKTPQTSSESTPKAAELVLLRIMSSLCSLQDLASCAIINKGMLRVYQQNELALLVAVLKTESVPAWELREWSAPQDPDLSASMDGSCGEYTVDVYREHLRRDATVLREIKQLMLKNCQTFLRLNTVEALSGHTGEAARRLDDALYRIWCFCSIFGGNKDRNDDVAGQLDWLKGGVLAHQETCAATVSANMDFDESSVLLNPPDFFGACNAGGLTSGQLYDMTEVWNCLAALLQNYQGKILQARVQGVLSTASVDASDVEKQEIILEEWIFYILSIGPAAVLELARLSDNVDAGFALAEANGWTDWMPPASQAFHGSRSTFLKEPVARLYEERMVSEPTPSRLTHKEQERKELTRKRVANLAQEIRLARCSSSYKRLPLIDMSHERPWSVVSQQTASCRSSVTSVASVINHKKTMNSIPSLSARPAPASVHPAYAGRRVSPIKEGEVQTYAAVRPEPLRTASSKVRADTAAIAVQKIVSMGFTAGQAREALRTTELPDGLDVTRAVEMLLSH